MKKLIKPLSIFLAALIVIGGAGYWWFSRAPLASEFIAIIPDQAYIDWEADKLPTVDRNDDHIADALLIAAANSTEPLPVLISLTYDEQAKTAAQQLEKMLVDRPAKLYPSASVVATTADLATVRQIAHIEGVVLVEEDIEVAGLSRAVALSTANQSSPIQTAAVALIDGGTTYATTHREVLVNSSGAGLNHGNLVAENILKVDPSTQIVDVTVLDSRAQAPVSRLIEGVDWVIQSKDQLGISAINASAGYVGQTNFAFNRALSAAAASGLAVVVPIAPNRDAGAVAAKVPGVVRVGYYTEGQPASANYTKTDVDMLAPTGSSSAGASAAAAEISGVVSRLINQTTSDNTDWWEALSTTVFSINDVIKITENQLGDISTGDEAAAEEFMRSLSGQLQEAIDQLKANLGSGEDDQLLKQLLDVTSQLLNQFPYSTDSSANWNNGSDANLDNLLGNLLNNLGNENLE